MANGVDGGDDFYYDATTGKLVALVAHDYNRMTARCLGGPADFVEPHCDWVNLECHDAGSEAGSGGSGDT